ncbi:: HTH_17 [Gemmata massiliana]|uniref:: HTH_17 n=1 Tax=Gemmata massiliana TaxID=1210884 RepID=A0A6P2DGD5_9BACT|nr:helix-turn-helix domain-containing protein [Gemmata massiliana]VTS00797.1 : HTH_17 [Gemmata massiliana]
MPRAPAIPLPHGGRWMDSKEVARVFGVGTETINRWVRDGDLKAYQPAKYRFFKKSEINKILMSKELPVI